GRQEPKTAEGNEQEAENDAALVTEFARQEAGGQRHDGVAHVMGELHPGRLRLGQVQLVLKMFVHRVDHPVAKSPNEEKRGNQEKREGNGSSIRQFEQRFLLETLWGCRLSNCRHKGDWHVYRTRIYRQVERNKSDVICV